MSAANVIAFPPPGERKAEASRQRASELDAMRVVDRAADVLDRLEERAAQLAKRIAQLQNSKKLAEQRAARVEERILAEMSRRGLSKSNGFRRLLAAKANPPKLLVVNESLIPREYMRTKTVEEPMKDAIKTAMAMGEDISGVRIVQGVSLRRESF